MEYKTKALTYKGCKQGDKKHKEIIDGYNKMKTLPRGYKVKYSDDWCATFVSFILYSCNAKNPPCECSVPKMWAKAKKNKQIVNTPKINDVIVYDWGNNGTLDHVGIIYNIKGNTLYVIEGNKSNACGTRTISKNSNVVHGFIRVPQNTTTVKKKKTNTEIAKEVIKGKYGNGDDRKKAIEKLGYNYSEIQKIVNELKSK